MGRLLKHLSCTHWHVRRRFPVSVLAQIRDAVKASESRHRGEVRLVIEGGLDPLAVVRGVTPRERAIELFSRLRVWDTTENSGVLIYLQLADRDIEILADRGIAARVPADRWEAICRRMEAAFGEGRYVEGVLNGIDDATALLVEHFPATSVNPDELPDEPVVL